MKPILVIKSPIEQPEGKDFMADVKREYHVLWIHGTYEDFSLELLTVNKAEVLTEEKLEEIKREIAGRANPECISIPIDL